MDFLDLVRHRYSVRSYLPTPVEEDKLARILEAGRLAPTAANRQAVKILVLKTAGREADLGRVYGRAWFTQAPLVIAVCTVPAKCWVRKPDGWNAGDVDATIVMDHLVLAATSEGLGTCWIANFDPVAAREVLRLPVQTVPVMLTTLGYAAGEPPAKTRKPLAELVELL